MRVGFGEFSEGSEFSEFSEYSEGAEYSEEAVLLGQILISDSYVQLI